MGEVWATSPCQMQGGTWLQVSWVLPRGKRWATLCCALIQPRRLFCWASAWEGPEPALPGANWRRVWLAWGWELLTCARVWGWRGQALGRLSDLPLLQWPLQAVAGPEPSGLTGDARGGTRAGLHWHSQPEANQRTGSPTLHTGRRTLLNTEGFCLKVPLSVCVCVCPREPLFLLW